MGTKNNPGEFDCYANAAPDEPMFILLGRDRFAPPLVELWANLREQTGEDARVVSEAREAAAEMEKWLTSIGKTRQPITHALPLNDEVKWILGRPNFLCRDNAEILRLMGWEIPHRSEDEQAATIYWMLTLYLTYGDDWREQGQHVIEELQKKLDAEKAADLEHSRESFGDLIPDKSGPDDPIERTDNEAALERL